MQTYTKKLPQYQAVQFTGSIASADEVSEFIEHVGYYVEKPNDVDKAVLCIAKLVIPSFGYVVKAPDGTLSVMTSREMAEQFDLVREPHVSKRFDWDTGKVEAVAASGPAEATLKVDTKLVFNDYGPSPVRCEIEGRAPNNRISEAVERKKREHERTAHLAVPNPLYEAFVTQGEITRKQEAEHQKNAEASRPLNALSGQAALAGAGLLSGYEAMQLDRQGGKTERNRKMTIEFEHYGEPDDRRPFLERALASLEKYVYGHGDVFQGLWHSSGVSIKIIKDEGK